MALQRLAIAIQTTSVHMKVISLALDQVLISGLATRRTLSMLLNCSLDSDICDLTTLTCFAPCHRGRFGRFFVCTFDLETRINEGRKIGALSSMEGISAATLSIVLIMMFTIPN